MQPETDRVDSAAEGFRSFLKTLFVIIQCIAIGAVLFIEIRAWNKPGPSCGIAGAEMLIALMVVASSLLFFGLVKRLWKWLATFLLLLLEAFALVYVPNEIRSTRRERLELTDPGRAVADAREIIRNRPAGQFIDPKALPSSLRIPQVYRVQAHGDHLDLITDMHPDGHAGFRIWSAEATRPREERPTKYRDISLYYWNNDLDAAPDNLP